MNITVLQKITTDIAKLEIKAPVKLPAYGSWPETVHQFDEKSINVLKTALAARRPVLLRGDPGTGKSQLAHAAAVVLGRLFVYEVVNAHTEGQDLLWKFDAVSRLAEAQTIKAGDDKKPCLIQNVLSRLVCCGGRWIGKRRIKFTKPASINCLCRKNPQAGNKCTVVSF